MKGGVGGGGVEKPLPGVRGRSPRRGIGGSAPDRRRHRQSPSVARAAKRQRADRFITFKRMAALGRAIGREPPKGVRASPEGERTHDEASPDRRESPTAGRSQSEGTEATRGRQKRSVATSAVPEGA